MESELVDIATSGVVQRVFFLNESDDYGDDASSVANIIEDQFGSEALVLQLPIRNIDAAKRGYVNLVQMRAYVRTEAESAQFETASIPENLSVVAHEYRELLLMAVAETDDLLLEKHLGGEELSIAEILGGIHSLIAGGVVCPVLCEMWRTQNGRTTDLIQALGQAPRELEE